MNVVSVYDLKNSGIYSPAFRDSTDFAERGHGNVCAVPVIIAYAADVVSLAFRVNHAHTNGLRLNVDVGRTFGDGLDIKLPPDSSH